MYIAHGVNYVANHAINYVELEGIERNDNFNPKPILTFGI